MSAQAELTRELERLGARFGATAVREGARRLFKGIRGNKPKSDWPPLMAGFEADSRDLLNGRNPMQIRSNYKIANEFADKFPDKNVDRQSIVKKIERKLKKERQRCAMQGALWIAEKEYSFLIYLEIYGRLVEIRPGLKKYLEFQLNDLAIYRNLIGEPCVEMTIGEIRARLERRTTTPHVNFMQSQNNM